MGSEMEILRDRFSHMEDEELVRIVGEEASDYRPEAIEIAREEIRRRGLQPSTKSAPRAAPATEDAVPFDSEEDSDEAEVPEPEFLLCPACGRGLRSAVLLADHQIIAVFEDNHEARYVKVLVCPNCGTADMFVDFNTKVTE